MAAKLVELGDEKETILRLLKCIDDAENMKKVWFLVNATRALLANLIEHKDYFRVCNAITNTLEEDLVFLSQHIGESDIKYSNSVQGLFNSGLMYQSVYDGGNAAGESDQRYSFTPFAQVVERYAINFNNVDKYPAIKRYVKDEQPRMKTDLKPQVISKEDIDEIMKH